MVKAEDFWNYLCEDFNYRFFAGVACPGLIPLYGGMDSKIMHYIPAANERIALGMVSGAYFSGFKGGLLMDMKFSYDLTSLLNFNIEYRIPLLVIGYDHDESLLAYDFPSEFITNDNFKTKLKSVINESEEKSVPGLIIFKGGTL